MDAPRPTLVRRVSAVLRARQFIVFYAMALYAFDLAVLLLVAWLRDGEPVAVALERSREPLAQAVAAGDVLLVGAVALSLLTISWFRAGYIRSLVGGFRLRPAGTRQFLSLLALETLLTAAAAAAGLWTTGTVGLVTALAVFALYVIALYADYVIVLAGVGPVAALKRSWLVVRAAPLPSFAVLMAATLCGVLAATLPGAAADGGLAAALPLLVVRCVFMGVVLFVADVVLVVLYLDNAATEAGEATQSA